MEKNTETAPCLENGYYISEDPRNTDYLYSLIRTYRGDGKGIQKSKIMK